MRKIAAALGALALGACGGAMTAQESSAKEAFEVFRTSALEGRMEDVFTRMSRAYTSNWIFRLLVQGDALAQEWRASLTGTPRTDLDLWLEYEKKHSKDRVQTLYPSVLSHPSLRQLCLTLLRQEQAGLRSHLSQVLITRVAGDETGTTIVVRDAGGDTSLYELVREDGMWKINGYRPALGGSPR